AEVLPVAHRLPGQKIFAEFRTTRQHVEQHDGFVEAVEIVGSEACRRVDAGFGQRSLGALEI
ncbi:MAG: hypothetical protein WCB77_00720, partial [Pseudolabrys sp.]